MVATWREGIPGLWISLLSLPEVSWAKINKTLMNESVHLIIPMRCYALLADGSG